MGMGWQEASGEMACLLGALAPAEDQSSIPTPTLGGSRLPIALVSGPSDLLGDPHLRAQPSPPCTCILIKNKNKT